MLIYEFELSRADDPSNPDCWDDPTRRPEFNSQQKRHNDLLRVCQLSMKNLGLFLFLDSIIASICTGVARYQIQIRRGMLLIRFLMYEALSQAGLRHQPEEDCEFSVAQVHIIALVENLVGVSKLIELPFCGIRQIVITVRHQNWTSPHNIALASMIHYDFRSHMMGTQGSAGKILCVKSLSQFSRFGLSLRLLRG